MTTQSAECCPLFDVVPWQDREFAWQDKLFVRATVPQFLHIPLPGSFGKAVTNMWQRIEAAGARPDNKDFVMLTSETSAWKGEILINVTMEIPGLENVKLSGTFLTKVFDGPYSAVPKWIAEMGPYVAGKGKTVKKYYFYYAYCPKCAKKYGHNYAVAFAQV